MYQELGRQHWRINGRGILASVSAGPQHMFTAYGAIPPTSFSLAQTEIYSRNSNPSFKYSCTRNSLYSIPMESLMLFQKVPITHIIDFYGVKWLVVADLDKSENTHGEGVDHTYRYLCLQLCRLSWRHCGGGSCGL